MKNNQYPVELLESEQKQNENGAPFYAVKARLTVEAAGMVFKVDCKAKIGGFDALLGVYKQGDRLIADICKTDSAGVVRLVNIQREA